MILTLEEEKYYHYRQDSNTNEDKDEVNELCLPTLPKYHNNNPISILSVSPKRFFASTTKNEAL